jgi:hypothetical protein
MKNKEHRALEGELDERALMSSVLRYQRTLVLVGHDPRMETFAQTEKYWKVNKLLDGDTMKRWKAIWKLFEKLWKDGEEPEILEIAYCQFARANQLNKRRNKGSVTPDLKIFEVTKERAFELEQITESIFRDIDK